jgi:hypothetical protein
LDGDFLAAIDKARGARSRSQFLRDALYHYLTDVCKVTLPEAVTHAPDRAGKGGRPRKSAEKAEEVPVKSGRKKAG